jgi:hypothetical protein
VENTQQAAPLSYAMPKMLQKIFDFSKNGYGFFAKSVIYLYYHPRKDLIA